MGASRPSTPAAPTQGRIDGCDRLWFGSGGHCRRMLRAFAAAGSQLIVADGPKLFTRPVRKEAAKLGLDVEAALLNTSLGRCLRRKATREGVDPSTLHDHFAKVLRVPLHRPAWSPELGLPKDRVLAKTPSEALQHFRRRAAQALHPPSAQRGTGARKRPASATLRRDPRTDSLDGADRRRREAERQAVKAATRTKKQHKAFLKKRREQAAARRSQATPEAKALARSAAAARQRRFRARA